MHLELLKAYSNLLNAQSKYGGSCSGNIMKAECFALFEKIEQLPPYFESALSTFRDILNVHRATLGASLMQLEQQKNTPNWESSSKIRLSLSYPIGFMLIFFSGVF
jgi:hypothetical protein